MLDHYIQRNIVYKLAFTPSLRFSELKPDGLENKLFDYHLKKVIRAGLVQKIESGMYELTPSGRKLGVHVLETNQAVVDQAHSVLFLVVRRPSDSAWLLYRRKHHPLIDRVGFMHTTPIAHEAVAQTATTALREKTGLQASFTALGGGFFRIFEGEALESFTHFTLLVAEDASGELEQTDKNAEYFWQTNPNFNAVEMLPNMPLLVQQYEINKPFFIEATLSVDQA